MAMWLSFRGDVADGRRLSFMVLSLPVSDILRESTPWLSSRILTS